MNLEDCRLGIFLPMVWKLYKAACIRKLMQTWKREKVLPLPFPCTGQQMLLGYNCFLWDKERSSSRERMVAQKVKSSSELHSNFRKFLDPVWRHLYIKKYNGVFQKHTEYCISNMINEVENWFKIWKKSLISKIITGHHLNSQCSNVMRQRCTVTYLLFTVSSTI